MYLAGVGYLWFSQKPLNFSTGMERGDQGRHVSAVECVSLEVSYVVKLWPDPSVLMKSLEGNHCQLELG